MDKEEKKITIAMAILIGIGLVSMLCTLSKVYKVNALNHLENVGGMAEMLVTVKEAPKHLDKEVYSIKVEYFISFKEKSTLIAITTNPDIRTGQQVKIRRDFIIENQNIYGWKVVAGS